MLVILLQIGNYDAGWTYGFALHYMSTGATMLQQQVAASVCCSASIDRPDVWLFFDTIDDGAA